MIRNITVNTYENGVLLFKEQTTCILEDDLLIYNTDNDKIKINLNNFSFTKENVESILKLTNDRCSLTLKEEGQSLDIPLEYVNYMIEKDKAVIIEYKLISQDLPLKIMINIGEEINEI